jgi:hypothetical protein
MRHQTITLSPVALAVAGLIGLAGCDLDVPDLNNPGLDQLAENPTPSRVSAACTGLLIGNRAGTSAANGYVSQLGILGRESYNFDPADPRYVNELLQGPLQPGSPFGGNFWAAPYTNIRLGHIIIEAADKLEDFDTAQKNAIKGFVHTINALDLLRVIVTRDTIGAVVDTNRDIDDLGPLEDRDTVYQAIANQLDDAAGELAQGGDAFPFGLSNGYSGFDAPATFLTFNRAMRARVAIYQEDYATALTALEESFLDPEGDLDLGVYHSFSTGTGDAQNGLPNVNIFAHPSVLDEAQPGDARVMDADGEAAGKLVRVPEDEAGEALGHASDLKYTMYTPDAPVPIIRNEELILLRAEAEWGQGDLDLAIADLNIVREAAGLDPLAAGLDAQGVEDELLYNRRYSLLFEGGHRWIDLRRFGRTDEIPIDLPVDVLNLRFPLPQAECDGRPGEDACTASTM